MANVPKAITDLPVASAMGDDDLLVVSQNATTSSIKGELIKGYAQNAVASQVTAAQTAATQAGDAKTDAETARNEAETSASSAANSASDAESAATEAEQAKTYIENMNMEGETLPAGSSVTVTKTTSPEGNLLFVIGVPQGIQGDKGETGETGATGPQGVSVTNATVNEDGDLVITLSSGSPINAGSVIGPQGIQGEVGPTGASVDRIERTSGTGAPGTTDTYTVYLTDGKTGGTFQVYNGSNGAGAGDFMADGSVPMTGDLQMGGHVVTGMADGTEPTDGATVGQLAGKLDSPDGGTAGQVLTKTANGSAWESAPSGLPDGGTEGQMLYKAADGAVWGDKPVMVVNVTYDETGFFSADKTVDEIKEAYLNGLNVYVLLDNIVFSLAAAFDAETGTPRFLFYAYLSSNSGETLTKLDNISIEIYKAGAADKVGVRSISGGLFPMNEGNQGEILYLANDDTAHWGPAPKGIPDGGTTGQVLTKTSTGEEWSDAPSGLPEGGAEGQILKRGASGAEWDDAEWLPLSGGTITGRLTTPELWGKSPDSSFPFFSMDASSGSINIPMVYTREPSDSQEIANKQYVDTQLFTKLTTPTGTAGQLLGFIEDNTVGAVDAPESGLTQEQADERYLQLSGGTMTGDIFFDLDAQEDRVGAIQSYNCFVGLDEDNGITIGYLWNALEGRYSQQINFGPTAIEVISDVGGFRVSKTPSNNDDVANKAYVDSKSPTSVTITLSSSSWSSNTQTVTVSGVSATETAQLITPTPAIASQSAYYEAGIMCTGQAANSLTFTCQTVPTSNLTVYVVIQPLS